MEKPDVDEISGISPAIAIRQQNHVKTARSTVGTATEVHDYLRLLFARAATMHCPGCDQPVRPDSPSAAAVRTLETFAPGTKLHILFAVARREGSDPQSLLDQLPRRRFRAPVVGGRGVRSRGGIAASLACRAARGRGRPAGGASL
jgi:excinuclease ABC subunit A